MDEQGSFQVPEVDSGKVISGSNAYFTGQGLLQFNKTYKTRVRVWNSYDVVSGWTVGAGNFSTPPYAYPQVDFSWTANGILNNPSPPLNKLVSFTDATVFNGNPNGRRWSWNFGDSGTSTLQNPSHTYSVEGSYYVTLSATDNANQTCARTKGPLIIQKPIPKWREIAPK
ncbi:MAG: PKD domain-containing protein [Candidatus Yanofskybacteria bacterium]|nr:PKD domain-containing protein [Candidatus Yanofskybacteria bacterium]